MESSQIIDLLKGMHLFSTLDESQVSGVSKLFQQEVKRPDQVIIKEGEPSDKFYIILQGNVVVSRKVADGNPQVDVLVPGDYFGEEGLLQNKPRTATITADGVVTLLVAGRDNFHELLMHFPQVKIGLERIVESRHLARRFHLKWLNDDEVIYQVRRRSEWRLALLLLAPLFFSLIFFIAALMIFLGLKGGLRTTLLVVDGVFFTASMLVITWLILDWTNDYYIVTNQRAVWVEQVIGFYESRVEAPLDMITSVKTTTSYLGRLLGYGDIAITTFTGSVVLPIVSEPYLVEALIRELWQRTQRAFKQETAEDTRRSVLRVLGTEPPAPKQAISPPAATASSTDIHELGFTQQYFGNIFKMRFEQGNTITYRKHWLLLVRRAWRPLLIGFVLFLVVAIYTGLYLAGKFTILNPLVIIGLFILLSIPLFLWWLYNYLDWRNDIYQLTDKNLFDIERKPFGTETRKAAPLEKILSLEHERPGLIGYLFNVGVVKVNTGEAKLDFEDVYEPARVQTDIFRRMQELRTAGQKAELERERDRVLSLLNIYHQEDSARDVFQALMDTVSLWYAALVWATNQPAFFQQRFIFANRLKANLAWLKEPRTEEAFLGAFGEAIRRYYTEQGSKPVAQAVALVMAHIAQYDPPQLDRVTILYLVLSPYPNTDLLPAVIQRHEVAYWRLQVSRDEVVAETQNLITNYLSPEFANRPYFAGQIGFLEIATALQNNLVPRNQRKRA
jgi:CRP-like cAMP-binding protein/uncharacterized membrane protein YdbT with pleckstrin-like domain